MLWLAVLVWAPCAAAQGRPSTLIVLRAEEETSADLSLIAELDRSLLHSLAHDAGFSTVAFSPTPFADVQLLAECAGSQPPCLRQVAAALQQDWVLLRQWTQTTSGDVELTLRAQDGTDAEVERSERAIVPHRDTSAAAAQLRDMVVRLYGGPSSSALAAAAPDSQEVAAAPHVKHRLLRGLGWSSLAGGAGLLAYGTAVGIKSQRAHDDYQHTDVRTMDGVDRSTRLLQRSQSLAATANRFFVAGASFALAGVFVLAWDALRPAKRADNALALNLTSSRSGAAIQLSGQFGGQ